MTDLTIAVLIGLTIAASASTNALAFLLLQLAAAAQFLANPANLVKGEKILTGLKQLMIALGAFIFLLVTVFHEIVELFKILGALL